MRVLVIGGGASGLMAALTAAQNPENEVTVLERQARVGKKLSATGNGRCNLTNLHTEPGCYHGQEREFVHYALSEFSVADTLSFFRSLGLLTVSEPSGRVYPYSDQAGSVVDVLRLSAEAAGVRLMTSAEVRSLMYDADAFFAQTEERRYAADAVIVACGGLAGEKLGGCGMGYDLLKRFGHSCTKLYPALVQLRTDTTYVRSLKGIRAECGVSLLENGELLASSNGEVQFTDYGISGPAVFEISRAMAGKKADVLAELDLLPLLNEEETVSLLRAKTERMPKLLTEDLLTGTLQNRLGRTVLRYCGIALDRTCGSVKNAELRKIAEAVKRFRIPVTGTMNMDQAQVTAGGIRTSEFDPKTMGSRLQRGLYACGEVLDIDGDCGGFNLQWAWSSGHLAGLLKGSGA